MELQGERMNPMRMTRPVLLMLVLLLISAVQVYSQLPPPLSSHPPTDLNGDGKADLVWHHATTGLVVVWLMNGTQILQVSIVAQVSDLGWKIAGVADLDGDGKGDVVWHHAITGHVAVWLMNGTTIAGSAVIAQVGDLGWQIARQYFGHFLSERG
jgi:sRNA-binding regulator protein Hfq